MNLFTFNPGDLIVSSQINANFQEFVRVLGQNSTSESLSLPGRLTLGQQRRASISALSDKKSENPRYLHIGWNAEEYFDGDEIKLQRKTESISSSSLRIGTNGLEFFFAYPSRSISTIPRIFAISGSRAYLNSNWSFSSRFGSPQSIEDYRLMLSPLSAPIEIYKSTSITGSSTPRSVNLDDFASKLTTTNYHGVELSVTAKAGSAPAEIQVYGKNMNPYTGLILNLGSNQQDSARGCMVFQRGETSNQTIMIKSISSLSSLTINIVGLWK